MKNLRTSAAAVVAAAALSTGGVSVASAATASHPTGHAPCSTQQAHVDKAQAKLDWLTQRLAARSAKVKQDRRAVAVTKGSAKARARKALAADKAAKAQLAQATKAQVQRVAHATAALDKCQAGAPATPTTTPTTGA